MVSRKTPVKPPLTVPQVARLLATKDSDFPVFVRLGARPATIGAIDHFPPAHGQGSQLTFYTDPADPDGCATGDIWGDLTGEMRVMKPTERRKSRVQFEDYPNRDRLYYATAVSVHKGVVTIHTEKAPSGKE